MSSEIRVVAPPDGGWGWVLVLAGFGCTFILDGTSSTFGPLLEKIRSFFRFQVRLTIDVQNKMSIKA